MASNADSANTSELPAFSSLKPYEQRAIVLKANGQTNEVIANQINAEFELTYASATVATWFWADGRLLQAYQEYNEALADMAVAEAKRKIKKASEAAADALKELMGGEYEGSVRVRAAMAILNKFVPDRQVLIEGGKENTLPPELADAMTTEVRGDNPPDSPPAD